MVVKTTIRTDKNTRTNRVQASTDKKKSRSRMNEHLQELIHEMGLWGNCLITCDVDEEGMIKHGV